MIKFLAKYDYEIYGILCYIISTLVLRLIIDEAPSYFYIKHLIICLGLHAFAHVVSWIWLAQKDKKE
jgi:hypothetical protein